jgi:iron complex transport system ATP-binding protein
MFLKLKNTTIGYQIPLIKGVETSLDLGEICLIIGNNGTGKTTLIKSILKQIPLLNGEILINNTNISKLSNKEIAENIAVVFSKGNTPSQFTVFQLIALGKYIYYPYYFQLNETDIAEVNSIIDQLQLSEFKNINLDKLSDGNLQKAFIGRALAQNSPIIILDEPTTHLDENNKIILLQLLRNLAEKQNKLILFSSHDWRLAKEFADKIWYVKDGNIQAGIAEDIIINNTELASPNLFKIHENFVPPKIEAPELLKELLYSFLQKNYQKNLSNITIIWNNNVWYISYNDIHETAQNFDDISTILSHV